jgi:hypothetical protein
MSDEIVVDAETGEILSESTEVAVVEHGQSVTLFGTDNPVEVIERSGLVATALADLIEQRNLYAVIGGRKHVLVEGWTMLGSMLGVFPVMVACEAVVIDGVHGFEATVEARTRSGEVVGRASALCLRSERTWKSRDAYALQSMAQTRATSKALRLPLGFVMQIAGYDATPAEEIRAERQQAAAAVELVPLGEADKAMLDTVLSEACEIDPELWADNKVLATASRRFGRKIESLDTLQPDEAKVIIEGALKWIATQMPAPESSGNDAV